MARVLRLPRHDDESSFVLVHVSSAGPRPLDVKLIGTEGSVPYVASLKHNQIFSLKAKNCPCNQEEWGLILSFILLGASVEDGKTEVIEGVEAVASVEGGSSITINIRKRIQGITQRLGTVSLPTDEDQEIELYDWCGLAIQSTSTSAQELSTLKSKFQEQQETIKKLNDRIEELITAKADYETVLIRKFQLLLNEKKSKIRDQQRLLASANVDPEKLAAVEAARKSAKSRIPGTSRAGKRKAGKSPNSHEDDDIDDRFEKMDVDVDQVPNDSEQEQMDTPDEDETADEAEDSEMEEAPPAPPPARASRRTVNVAANAKGAVKEKGNNAKAGSSKAEAEDDKVPPRDLPFTKQAAPAAKPTIDDAGEETESDDEL